VSTLVRVPAGSARRVSEEKVRKRLFIVYRIKGTNKVGRGGSDVTESQ
jgi:hypothetical protein